MKKHLSVLLFFVGFTLFAQDPGHCLFLRIFENKKQLKGKNLNGYKVILRREYMRFNGDHFLNYNTDSSAFFYFDWNLFGSEIYEVKIKRQQEIKVVRFKMEPDSLYKKVRIRLQSNYI